MKVWRLDPDVEPGAAGMDAAELDRMVTELEETLAAGKLFHGAQMTVYRGGSLHAGLRVPKPLAKFIAQKGSVALDGISLTVNEVADDTFSVLIIPHTLAVTTLGPLRAGDQLNLEVDVMARYAARLMETR